MLDRDLSLDRRFWSTTLSNRIDIWFVSSVPSLRSAVVLVVCLPVRSYDTHRVNWGADTSYSWLFYRNEGRNSEIARPVVMSTCHGKGREQKWVRLPTGQLQHVVSKLCITAPLAVGDVLAAVCKPDVFQQIWIIDYTEDNDFKRECKYLISPETPGPLRPGVLKEIVVPSNLVVIFMVNDGRPMFPYEWVSWYCDLTEDCGYVSEITVRQTLSCLRS